MKTMKLRILYTTLCMISFLLIAFPSQLSATVDAQQQGSKIVKGVIKDATGEFLPGVSITVKGTPTGTITDLDGNFSVSVPDENAVLVISYIGYKTQEIKVGSNATFTITLLEDTTALDEVVVVGYGVQKKANLTGAVSSVNFTDQAMSRPITNVSSALAGLAAGMQVMQTSGRPGDDSANILIRGRGTINDSSPLVLIDGMPGTMDSVNPQDIESFSILKDAASSSIYGSRAANGVILITTKKGQKGRVNVTYSGRISKAKPTNLVELVSDYATYMEYINEAGQNIGNNGRFSQSTIDLWREKSRDSNGVNENGVPNYVAYPNTDWQRELFNGGLIHDHNVSVNGGSENARYLLSLGYLDNQGLVENTGMQRYSLRANIESTVKPWLTLGMNLYASQENRGPGNFDNANNFLRQTSPGIYPRWNGKAGYPESDEENSQANGLYTFLNNQDGDFVRSNFNTTVYSKIKIWKGLSYDFNLNYKRYWRNDRSWTNAAGGEKVKHSTGQVMSSPTDPGQMTAYFYDRNDHSYTLENILRYDVTIAQDHSISALAGYQEYYWRRSENSAQKQGLPDPSIVVPESAVTMLSINGNMIDNATRSLFGRVNYAYKSRYLFEANLRHDGSSRYHKDYRWGTFPSLSAGWRISEEAFMESTRNVLDNLKLRISWGNLGNTGGDDVGNYEYQPTYTNYNYVLGGSLNTGLAPGVYANSLLSWESTEMRNIGVDVALLGNRLNFEFDVYEKITYDILYRPNIPLTAGTKTAPRMNIAEARNRGLELAAGWNDRINEFSYSVNANFAYNVNKISKYKGAFEEGYDENGVWRSNIGEVSNTKSDDGTRRVVEGKRIFEYYLKDVYRGNGNHFNGDGSVNINGGPKDGMIRTEQDMEWLKAMMGAGYTFQPNKEVGKSKIWYGDYIYADRNGDGVYGDTYDQYFQGTSADPTYNFGLQLSANWKGFDVSMNWAGAAGFSLYWAPTTGYNSTGLRWGCAIPEKVANDHYFYDPTNPADPRTNLDAKYGRLIESESGYQIHTSSTLHLYKGDYFKLKNLTIGYTLPKNITNRVYTENIRVYVSGENLLTFTKFPGQDPEVGAYPRYTTLRQWAFGVNVTF